jgi:hypothetical protein
MLVFFGLIAAIGGILIVLAFVDFGAKADTEDSLVEGFTADGFVAARFNYPYAANQGNFEAWKPVVENGFIKVLANNDITWPAESIRSLTQFEGSVIMVVGLRDTDGNAASVSTALSTLRDIASNGTRFSDNFDALTDAPWDQLLDISFPDSSEAPPPVPCPVAALPTPAFGTATPLNDDGFNSTTNTYMPGAEWEIACNAGFRLQGSNKTRCNFDGQYSTHASPATCERRVCPEVIEIEDGQAADPTLVFEQTTTVTCNTGFTLTPNISVTCNENAGDMVLSPLPACAPNNCTNPTSPVPNSEAALTGCGSDIASGTTCNVTCSENYGFASGSGNSVECYAGQMRNINVECVQLTCDMEPTTVVQHSNATVPSTMCTPPYTSGNATCEVTCLDGYSLVAGEVWCLDSGAGAVWSQNGSLPLPQCLPQACPALATLTNGRYWNTIANSSFGTDATLMTSQTAELRCNQGYHIVGDASVSCDPVTGTSTVALSGTIGTCEPNACSPAPVAPQDGTVNPAAPVTGDTVDFTCPAGHSLIGEASILCLPSGGYTGPYNPTCTPNPCTTVPADVPRMVSNLTSCAGLASDDVCVVACESGYVLEGEYRCVAGVWTGTPVCAEFEPPAVADQEVAGEKSGIFSGLGLDSPAARGAIVLVIGVVLTVPLCWLCYRRRKQKLAEAGTELA